MRSLLRALVVLLVVIGVLSSVIRILTLSHVIEPFDDKTLVLLDAHPSAEEVQLIKTRYQEHRAMTLWHIVPGALFLALAPLQFSKRLRSRRPRIHRWSGRILLVLASIAVVPAFFFGLVIPAAGIGEFSSIAVFGILFIAFLAVAFRAIRRGDVASHREWMIRAFALAAGVATIRIVATPMQIWLKPTLTQLVSFSFWIGWTVTLVAAEIWIRYTRQTESVAGIGDVPDAPSTLYPNLRPR